MTHSRINTKYKGYTIIGRIGHGYKILSPFANSHPYIYVRLKDVKTAINTDIASRNK